MTQIQFLKYVIILILNKQVDKIPGGARLGFITIGDGKTEVLVYIDCLVSPPTGNSAPIFRAIRNGPLKDKVPPGEPRIMRSLLQALQKSVEIARLWIFCLFLTFSVLRFWLLNHKLNLKFEFDVYIFVPIHLSHIKFTHWRYQCGFKRSMNVWNLELQLCFVLENCEKWYLHHIWNACFLKYFICYRSIFFKSLFF